MVVVAVVAAVVAIAAGIAVGRPSQGFEAVGVTESVTLATVTEVSSVELTVHVAGAVARPGLGETQRWGPGCPGAPGGRRGHTLCGSHRGESRCNRD